MSIHDLKNALQFVIGQRESGEYPGPGCSLGCVSAKPVRVEDPNDPEVILQDLPVRERAEFLRQYREAVGLRMPRSAAAARKAGALRAGPWTPHTIQPGTVGCSGSCMCGS